MVEKHSGYDLQGEVKIGGAASEVGQVIKGQGAGSAPVWGYDDYGLSFIGVVTTATDITHFKASALAGFGNDYFNGYYIYVIWDAGGAGGAPQGEHRPISDYDTSDGTFTHTAFTAQLALTDKVLIVHPAVARVIDSYALLTDATDGLAAIKAEVEGLAGAAMVGTNGAALASAWTATLAGILANYTADRAGYLDELAAANLPTDIAAIPTENYFEQVVPIKMNCTQTVTSAKADKVFIAQGATGASGLIGTDDTKVQKVMLLIIGRAVNIYAGTNALDCSAADGTPADNNQWQVDLDSDGWGDLTNEEADGQMLDNDWRCPVEGAIHPFTLMFDVDTEITNIDGKIGVQLKDSRSEQNSLIVTIDVYLRILWKL